MFTSRKYFVVDSVFSIIFACQLNYLKGNLDPLKKRWFQLSMLEQQSKERSQNKRVKDTYANWNSQYQTFKFSFFSFCENNFFVTIFIWS